MDAFLAIADEINSHISKILMGAVNGSERKYRTEDGYIKWGLVESDLHKVVSTQLGIDDDGSTATKD